MLVLVSGAPGGPFVLKYDWLKHAALVNELSATGWPTHTADGGVLRYYTGFYLVPAAAAKVVGGDPRLWLSFWMFTGLAVGLALLVAGLRARPAALTLAIFPLLSGIDVLGCRLTAYRECGSKHLEFWSGSTPVNSIMTAAMWRPSQLIPLLVLVPLILTAPTARRSPWLLGPLLVAGLLWAPLATVGVLPLVGWALWSAVRTSAVASAARDWLVPAILLLPAAGVVLAYLSVGAGDVPLAPLWRAENPAPNLLPWWRTWLAVVALEVLPLLALPLLVRRRLPSWISVQLIASGLLMLVVYGLYSDLDLNALLPLMVVLSRETAVAASAVLLVPARRRAGALATAAAVIAAGAATPFVELRTALQSEPYFVWEECRFANDACIRADLRYQYAVPGSALPSLLLRSA